MRPLLARRLVQIRRKRRLDQQQMADILGLPRGTYAGYEAGTRLPALERLIHLASRLGVSLDYLAGISNFELPVECGVKFGLLKKLRNVGPDDLQPYTPASCQEILLNAIKRTRPNL
jgi:transcriptional regulator with XRE-family HTH domain